ncbi:MAG: PD40 domain-containing protein [Armatimonadota bacterium]|nr:MAG: PD40 domain-containing protein [Armatimonadota bacterium]
MLESFAGCGRRLIAPVVMAAAVGLSPPAHSESTIVGQDGRIQLGGFSLMAYNPRTGELSDLGRIPTSRQSFTMIAAEGQLFFIGGRAYHGEKATFGELTTVDAYRPGQGWIEKQDMPSPGAGLMAEAVDGKVYVVAHRDSQFRVYDIEEDSWTTLSERMGGGGRAISCGVVDGRMLFLYSNPGGTEVRAFDPATGEWTTGPKMRGLRPLVADAVSGRAYVIQADQDNAQLLVYSPDEETWTVLANVPGELRHGAVLNPGGAFLAGDTATGALYAMSIDTTDLHLVLWRYALGGDPAGAAGEAGWAKAADFNGLMHCWAMCALDGRIYLVAEKRRTPPTDASQAAVCAAPEVTPESLAGIDDSVRKTLFAYVATVGQNEEIYISTLDNSWTKRLTRSEEQDSSPAWSFDGKKVAFVRSADIYTIRIDESGLKRLTADEHHNADGSPTWSPDGKSIAFTSRGGWSEDHKNWEIYRINVDGSGLMRLTYSDRNNVDPLWSPDGTMIAFRSMGPPTVVDPRTGHHVDPETGHRPSTRLYSMWEDGTGLIELADNIAYGPFLWSPDSSKMAYVIGEGESKGLYVVSADAASTSKIAANTYGIPAWSPDSRQIAFASYDRTGMQIRTANSDGSGSKAITTAGRILEAPVQWLPDGTIVLVGRTYIGAVNADGTGATKLRDFPKRLSHPIVFSPVSEAAE